MPWRLKPRLQPSKGPQSLFLLCQRTPPPPGAVEGKTIKAPPLPSRRNRNIGAGVMVPAASPGSANEAPRFGLFDAQSKRTLCCATGICARTFITRSSSIRAETIPTPSEALAMTWPQGSAISEWP